MAQYALRLVPPAKLGTFSLLVGKGGPRYSPTSVPLLIAIDTDKSWRRKTGVGFREGVERGRVRLFALTSSHVYTLC